MAQAYIAFAVLLSAVLNVVGVPFDQLRPGFVGDVPPITLVVFAASLLLAARYRRRARRQFEAREGHWLRLGLLVGYMLLSLAWSAEPVRGFGYIAGMVALAATLLQFNRFERLTERGGQIAVACFGLASLLAIFAPLHEAAPCNPNQWSVYAAPYAVFGLYYATMRHRQVGLLAFLTTLGFMVISGRRTGAVALGAGMSLLFLLRPGRALKATGAVLLVLTLAGPLIIQSEGWERVKNSVTAAEAIGSGHADDMGTDWRREQLVNNATAVFHDNPFFGTGVGGYWAELRARRVDPFLVARPHSLVIGAAAEMGLVGSLFLWSMILVPLWSGRRLFWGTPIEKHVMVGYVTLIVTLLASEYLYSPSFWSYYALAASFIYYRPILRRPRAAAPEPVPATSAGLEPLRPAAFAASRRA